MTACPGSYAAGPIAARLDAIFRSRPPDAPGHTLVAVKSGELVIPKDI